MSDIQEMVDNLSGEQAKEVIMEYARQKQEREQEQRILESKLAAKASQIDALVSKYGKTQSEWAELRKLNKEYSILLKKNQA